MNYLVKADETANNYWAIYNWDGTEFTRTKLQTYNTSAYWSYIDWYGTGYNEFTTIDHLISSSYQLESLDDSTGNVVKIENIGSGGWLLLEKIDNSNSIDYTINYKTIGRKDRH